MKTKTIFLTAFAAAVCAPLAAMPTTKLAAEWHVPFLFSDDRFALVDEASGTTRFAVMDARGQVAWPHNVPTGVANVSDTTASLGAAGGEVLAITSPLSNRVVLLDVESDAPYARPIPVLLGTGPSGLGALESKGEGELLIASSLNGVEIGMLESRAKIDSIPNVIANSNHKDHAFRRLQPVSEPGSDSTIALFTAASGAETTVGLTQPSSGSHLLVVGNRLDGEVEFATQVRSIQHPAETYLVGYTAGSDSGFLVTPELPLGVGSDLNFSEIEFPFTVSSVMPVLGGGVGPIEEGFVVFSADGSEALVMRVDASGEHVEETGEVFSAEPGMALSGLALVPGHGVVKLNAPAAGMPSTTYNAYQWDGRAWVETDSGSLPNLDDATAAPSSVLYFDAHPLLAQSARLLGVQSVPDWTSLDSYPDDFPSAVVRESFASDTSGLVQSGSAALNPPAGSTHVIANQAEPGVSIATLGTLGSVLSPQLRIVPESGAYEETFQVTASFEEDRYKLFFRRDDGDWLLFHTAVPVAWTTQLQFVLEDRESGGRGPIITRNYSLSPEAVADLDSDGDGVPDYVEEYFGLNPFGGADSDGDGYSDLDEILQGTNPADPTDSPDGSLNIALGGGLRLVALAEDFASREIADGEDLTARAVDGSLIARAAVGPIDDPLPDGTARGAKLESSGSPQFNALVALSSPAYFNNQNTGARTGREIICHIPANSPPEFAPDFTPTAGMSLEDAALGWVAAAIDAAAALPYATGITELVPVDSAVSVLLEHLTHTALDFARPGSDPAPAIDAFSFFPGRDADTGRATTDTADRALLRAVGFDQRLALGIAEDAADDMESAATSIYQRHAASSASTPGMLLPLDALRVMLRGGSAPEGYTGAVSAGNLAAARNAYNDALADHGSTFRATATWVVEITETPSPSGVYQRVSDSAEVVLLHPSGERFLLDRGLGLRPGSQFTVAGFIDRPAVTGRPAMGVISAALTFEPTSSDTDEDGNLLDDEWEKFFFGATGQDPFSEPHGNGYSLLQYFLDGIDPRTGAMPAGAPVNLVPQLPIFEPSGGGGYTLDFVFPADYSDRFAFILERSDTLAPGSFEKVPGVSITPRGGDELRVTIPEHEAPPGKAFYRVRISLK